MESAQRFGWLLTEVFAGLTVSGWIPAALLILVVLALTVRPPWQDPAFRRVLRSAALLLLLPTALVLLAAVFANEDPYRSVSPLREQLVLAVFLLNVLLALALIVAGRAHAWRAAALASANVWVAAWSAFVSTMSLTGNWL